MSQGEKGAVFWGNSLEVIREFPDIPRRRIGYQVYRLQKGLPPDDYKPVPEVGPGTQEIRVHEAKEYRVLYVAKFGDDIVILHAFIKKDEKIPKKEIELAKKRYKEVKREYGKA